LELVGEKPRRSKKWCWCGKRHGMFVAHVGDIKRSPFLFWEI
jgi:hypothetical protein